MQHDMAITKNHAIFLDPPLIFKPEAMLGSTSKMPFVFDRNRKARFGVIDREATKERSSTRFGVIDREATKERSSSSSSSSSSTTCTTSTSDSTRWFELDSCMFFHVANAWEEGSDKIKLFLCVFEDFDLDLDQVKPVGDEKKSTSSSASSSPSDNNSARSGYARLNEVTLDLKTGLATRRVLDDDLYGDFPRINEKLTGVKSRFAYVATMDPSSPVPLFDGGKGDGEREREEVRVSFFLFFTARAGRDEEEGQKLALTCPSLSLFRKKKKKLPVSKVDLLARDPSKAVVASFKYGKGRHGGEATFVADPHRRNGSAEDAGFLVT